MLRKRRIGLAAYLPVMAFVVMSMLIPYQTFAANAVDVIITSYDQHDTIWATWPSTFDIYIETDVVLAGMSLGHQFWSPDGAAWHWRVGEGYCGLYRLVTVNLDSRWGTMSCFDMGSCLVEEANIDEVGRDTIMTGGSGMYGCPTGPLEHIYSYNFIMDSPGGNDLRVMCIDSCFVPPAAPFVFVDIVGSAFNPDVLWLAGGRCWPVKIFPYLCGDANFDGDVNVGDILFIISYVFKGGPTPNPYCQADANGSNFVSVDDAVYLVNYVFKGGPPPVEPCCP